MPEYRYTDCGLENVIIEGVNFVMDDAGDCVVKIPNINGLHRVIAQAIVLRKWSMSGAELRFLRTELGLTQAELAALVHREPLALSRWERGEGPIDSNAEALIRLYALEKLELGRPATVQELSGWCIPSAEEQPIQIDGRNPNSYQRLAA